MGLREVGFLVVGLEVGLFVAVVVGGVGDGGVGPAMQMLGLNPPLSGVHLSTPSEYIPLSCTGSLMSIAPSLQVTQL